MTAQNRDGTGRGDVKVAEHLRKELARLGLNQIALGKAIGVSRQTINNILTGRQPISRAMAAKLGHITGRSSDYWLKGSFAESSAPPRAARGGVRVARGRGVRIVTGERLAFPHDHLARIGATPHLAQLGAIAAHAQHVEPGFVGKLEVCIFNAGDRDFVLKAGDPVLSLEIVPLTAPPGRAGRAGTRGKRRS